MTSNNTALAQAAPKRRAELGITLQDVSERGGPAVSTMHRIEQGGPGKLRPKTLQQVDVALDWAPGTAYALVTGSPAPSAQRLAAKVVVTLATGQAGFKADRVQKYETEFGYGLNLYLGEDLVVDVAAGTWILYELHYPTEG